MDYTPTNWVDKESPEFIEGESPALDTVNLNKIEQGIATLNNEKLDAKKYQEDIPKYEPVATMGGSIWGFKELACKEQIPGDVLLKSKVYDGKLYYIDSNYIYTLDLTTGELIKISPQLSAPITYYYSSGNIYSKTTELSFVKIIVSNKNDIICVALSPCEYERIPPSGTPYEWVGSYYAYFYNFNKENSSFNRIAKINLNEDNEYYAEFTCDNDRENIYFKKDNRNSVYKLPITNLSDYDGLTLGVDFKSNGSIPADEVSTLTSNFATGRMFCNNGNLYYGAYIFVDCDLENSEKMRKSPYYPILSCDASGNMLCGHNIFPVVDEKTFLPKIGMYYFEGNSSASHKINGFIYDGYLFFLLPGNQRYTSNPRYLFKTRLF